MRPYAIRRWADVFMVQVLNTQHAIDPEPNMSVGLPWRVELILKLQLVP